MDTEPVSKLIELTNAELDDVCGGVAFFGGILDIGGGSGPTAASFKLTINGFKHSVVFAENRSDQYADVIDGKPDLGKEQ